MTKNNGFKVAALAASIALAMAATSAMAADPAVGQLPGQGKITTGTAATVTVNNTSHTMGITLAANTVINWGAGTGAEGAGNTNSTGTAGFNIGKDATVNFTGAFPVLNIDSTGNASQIFGKLTSANNVFVANANGIIVGASGNIQGTAGVALIGNTLIDDAAAFNALTPGNLVNYQGAGGDVTVQPGATIASTGLIISGGGNVNVDLTNVTGTISNISAGLHGGTNPLATDNTSASVTVNGTATSKTIVSLGSAGTATTAGTLAVTTNASKALTNNGILTIGTNNAKGAVTNNGTLTLPAANGSLVNNGTVTAVATSTFTGLTNAGSIASSGGIAVSGGGNLVNTGTITGAGAVTVQNGYVDNSGSIAGATAVNTTSDNGAGKGFTAGGQYYINNTGSIGFATGGVNIDANATGRAGTGNDSTGSFLNSGTLTANAASDAMTIAANNNLSLGGTLKAGTLALSSGNALGAISLKADNGLNNTGTLTVSAPLFGAATTLDGNQVKLMKSVTGTTVAITAGAAPADDYAVRIAAGTTTKGSTSVTVNGRGTTVSQPNTILQGTVSSPSVTFGTNAAPVGDIISGPAGGITVSGATPTAIFNFAGRLKTAPYLNNANNFRYNYLPISLATGTTAAVALTLNPAKYQTNGTSNGKSGVNLMVNGDVTLTTMAIPAQASAATAVTGVTNWQNTHLVLQSAGDITMAGATYWPGYVYLGTVDSDSNGNGLAGTLSDDGKIDLSSAAFNNVLPGDVAGASGIHFMTGNALANGTTVTTNANALINFPTDTLTQAYATGLLTVPTFKGGTASGLVVTYGTLDPSFFNTHPVDATK